jgi:hypothetical protein
MKRRKICGRKGWERCSQNYNCNFQERGRTACGNVFCSHIHIAFLFKGGTTVIPVPTSKIALAIQTRIKCITATRSTRIWDQASHVEIQRVVSVWYVIRCFFEREYIRAPVNAELVCIRSEQMNERVCLCWTNNCRHNCVSFENSNFNRSLSWDFCREMRWGLTWCC